ncbi:MAG TPA: CSLREA domain-containing protein, partial [Anaerolineae bacterium]|nr:CSLREA domain-containing protein [Anaerolineae bacterium]
MNTVSNFPRALNILHIFVIIALIVGLPSPVAMANPIGSTDSSAARSVLLAPTASIVVNTTADELTTDGNCSLREAIMAANTNAAVDACTAGSGADTIVLPAGTYLISIAGANENANLTGDF